MFQDPVVVNLLNVMYKLRLISLILITGALHADPFSDAVNQNSADGLAVQTANNKLGQDVASFKAKYALTNADACALLIIGNTTSGTVPVSFIPGPTPIVALQGDIVTTPQIPVLTVTTGPAATAAGKTVFTNQLPGAERFIVLGLDQTGVSSAIGVGLIASINLDVSQVTNGSHVVSLTNFVAGDAAGNSVPLCVTTGVLTK